MADPRTSRNFAFAALIASIAAILIAFKMPDAGRGFTLQAVLGFCGFTVLPFALIYAVMKTTEARRLSRLQRGIGVIARWTVDRAAWDEFAAWSRSYDDSVAYRNDLDLDKAARSSGNIEVVVAENALTVGNEFESITKNVQVTIHGTCMEFDQLMSNPDGADWHKIVRVPIARGAERDAIRVQEHYTREYLAAATNPRAKLYIAVGFFGFFALVILLAYWWTGGK